MFYRNNKLPRKKKILYCCSKRINWDKAFKSGLSKICGRQPALGKPYPFKFLKGCCLPQILLGPFLNTLSQLTLTLKRLRGQFEVFSKMYFLERR